MQNCSSLLTLHEIPVGLGIVWLPGVSDGKYSILDTQPCLPSALGSANLEFWTCDLIVMEVEVDIDPCHRAHGQDKGPSGRSQSSPRMPHHSIKGNDRGRAHERHREP
jgi:hypothetical protein